MAEISKITLLNGDIYDLKDGSAITNITRSGTTFTATRRNGTTFTFSQQDNNTTYDTATTSANGLMSSTDKTRLNNLSVAFATCGTAAGTKDKVATVTGGSFSLVTGAIVGVKFTNTNTYAATAESSVTLNVNSTGAKPIYYANSAAHTGTNTTPFGRAKYINFYMYDGTNWVWLSSSADNNTTYSAMTQAVATAGTNTTGRLITAKVLNDTIVGKGYTSNTGTVTSVATGTGLTGGTITTSGTIGLANSGVTAGSYGPSTNASPAHSGTFSVPYVTVDSTGRITAASTKTITLPADNNTTYSAGTGLSLSGTTFNHSNSITAGIVGTSNATSGSTVAIPYITYDAQGHITQSGTHNHTIAAISATALTNTSGSTTDFMLDLSNVLIN